MQTKDQDQDQVQVQVQVVLGNRKSSLLQQLDQQESLQRRQLVAVIVLQDGDQVLTEVLEARQRPAVLHIEQLVEEVQPHITVRDPEETRPR